MQVVKDEIIVTTFSKEYFTTILEIWKLIISNLFYEIIRNTPPYPQIEKKPKKN